MTDPQTNDHNSFEAEQNANADYIAAANPQTMLEILAYIDQLEKECAVKQDTIDQQNGIIAKFIKADWLAEFAVGGECPPEYEHARAGGAVVHCHHDCKECWKEAAEDVVDGGRIMKNLLMDRSVKIAKLKIAMINLDKELKRVRRENALLEKEADWLAEHALNECPEEHFAWGLYPEEFPKWCDLHRDTYTGEPTCSGNQAECWRRIAREYVEGENGSEQAE